MADGVAAEISCLGSGDKQVKPSQGDEEGNDGVPINTCTTAVPFVSCGDQGKWNPFTEQPESLSGHAHNNLPCLDWGRHSPQTKKPECVGYNTPPNSIMFIPICLICGDPQLGRHCRALQLQWQCYWCGRTGHDEENCRWKSGACLICGSAKHRLCQCAQYITQKPPVFLSLPGVSGWQQSLGQDCKSPYME